MSNDKQRRLRLVSSGEERACADANSADRTIGAEATRDIDWTILMARAQDGDTASYLRLLHEITPYLRSLVRLWHKDHWDAEDTVQDILLTLHSIRHTYDPSRPFGPWLVGIANRRAVDRLRRRGRQALREAPLRDEHEGIASPSQDSDSMLDKHHLEEAIGSLPPIQQRAVDLLKLKEMSLKDAAAETGLSIASLKMATHRALKNLRAMLSDRGDS
ncbi:sigma-70 family RNA polymerase sigma factor [Gluconacetobacter asukensis]|uniref:Sigma-70 family RNA polymerase sigma factor n=1 Tax=Gluconacetobacter asukensis TaxID=1017181 RepID=A0A7W4IZA7_9PROT|nr:sigma-70 family RNA polymerase sigma factor [Gluconacetobacter asukensis]MBB2171789.1 sigma-70 family RNA polymerase sigma factor [Gluconacetobacter asukensis]